MTIAFRGLADPGFSLSGTSAGTISGLATGDYMLGKALTISGAFSALSGWTTISLKQDGNTGTYEYMAYRIATGAGSDTWNPVFAGGGFESLSVHAWSGTGLAHDAVNTQDNFNTTTWTGGSATPSSNSVWNILWTSGDTSGGGGVPSLPATWTDRTGNVYDKALSGQSGVGQNQAVTYTPASYGPMVNLIIKETSGTSYTLTADQGSYSLTGQAANLLENRIVTAAQGSYILTGQNANLTYSTASVLLAAQGSYTLIGSDALVDTSMNADQGSYTLTGFDANLVYTPLNAYTLVAAQGSYSLTGFTANLLENTVLVANKGQYNLTGNFAILTWSGAPVISDGLNITKRLYLGMRIGL